MRRAASLFLTLLFLATTLPVFAQESDSPGSDDDSGPLESDWSVVQTPMYNRGDQIFGISLGIILPLFFVGDSGTLDNNVSLGGTGTLSYDYFFSSRFAVGGEISGMFSSTLGENMLYIVPIGIRATYQFTLYSFEFPLTLAAGVAPQKYLDRGYFGMYIKPSAGVFWRFNSDWSFGLNTTWWYVPQWTSNKEENVHGNFLTITVGARYHF
ncbi:hypothetical protein JFL75_11325 [Breznakiella homolactica]|uniref:Outer membrane protein beta-barrel domain-containing protein n=2 Tax=Breznakiella homolactica TaxID=2798577 RepID=A0A7T7XRW9_9SPIR|nr:hypothetical protein JFL75_11325 [Breznakiella homolactica]